MSRFYDPATSPPERFDSLELWPNYDEVSADKQCVRMGLLPSVTTVLDAVRSPYLERWFIGEGIEEFKVNGGKKKEAVDHIYDRESTNAQFGTDCHEVMEAVMKGEPIPDVSEEVMKHSAPLIAWIKENVKETLFCEQTMASKKVGAAGTVDMVFTHKNGRRVVGDLKVVKFSWKFPPKPDIKYKMQLSAYEGMIQELRPDDYTRMSFYLASPFGQEKIPVLKTFEHTKCYLDAFLAARVLWENTLLQEMPKPMEGCELVETFDPAKYRK